MILEVKSGEDIKKIKELLADRPNKKKFDAKKFCGALKVDKDGLIIQKRLKNEWD